jgi:hypothetical protein
MSSNRIAPPPAARRLVALCLVAAACGEGAGGARGHDASDDAAPGAPDATVTPPDAAPPTPDAAPPTPDAAPPPEPDTPQGDLWTTHVTFDLAARTAVADLTLRAPPNGVVVLETGDLSLTGFEDADGVPVEYLPGRGRVTIATAGEAALSWRIRYGFQAHDGFRGLRAASPTTLTWPQACGNLFPCHSAPADGVLLSADVKGLAPGDVAVATPRLSTPAPAYQLAFAVGPYTRTPLGTSDGGVALVAFLRPGEEDVPAALAALPEVFGLLETWLGPYPFGPEAGLVTVDWGLGAVGGMEHHPYWHVSGAQRNLLVNAHEAVHGWFGNGVRLRCWEDEVLSEGVADYVSAEAVARATGVSADDVFAEYRRALETALPLTDEPRGRPSGCNVIDPSGPWFRRQIPYKRGALFLHAVAGRVGADAVLAALGVFHRAHVGRAAGVDDLVETLTAETGFDVSACAAAWLTEAAVPADGPCR